MAVPTVPNCVCVLPVSLDVMTTALSLSQAGKAPVLAASDVALADVDGGVGGFDGDLDFAQGGADEGGHCGEPPGLLGARIS